MFTHRLRAPSPAFVISLIALFLALGGTSYAATKVASRSTRMRRQTRRWSKGSLLRSA